MPEGKGAAPSGVESFLARLQDFHRVYRLWLDCERGLSSSTRELDIAHLLEDSIRYRLEALQFHEDILRSLFEAASAEQRRGPQRGRLGVLQSVAPRLQYLFDDVVFNAISLFDYLGCLVGLVVKGAGSHQINWDKGVGKATSAGQDSQLVVALRAAHNPFVRSLIRYRSELTHFRKDEVDGSVKIDLLAAGGGRLHVALPQEFAQIVRRSKGPGGTWDRETGIVEAASTVVEESVRVGTSVLEALHDHVSRLEVASPPRDTMMLVSRWIRGGLYAEITEDLQKDGWAISGIGSFGAETHLTLVVHLAGGQSVNGGTRDLEEFVHSVPTREEAKSILRALVPKDLAGDGG